MPYEQTGINPEDLNTDVLSSSLDVLQENFDNYKKDQTARNQAKEEREKASEKALAEQKDPRNKENWGVGAVAKELSTAIGGGLQDTASSLATFPERTLDMLNGEMAAEGANYRQDWDPLTD